MKTSVKLDEKLLLSIDLNFLLVLSVVYRERGVSRAADCLNVTQPAVSNTLSKLRIYFCDPLFIRQGRGLEPTSTAVQIMERLSPAILEIQSLLHEKSGTLPDFTPLESKSLCPTHSSETDAVKPQ
ncbi:LysR family transcriptional regulator [Pseudomonas syringae group genomosp. 3]|uniref:LysR family transcriptional regulator n=1 Tax=Pseudomonas syringae group genomosp. 3 TaxID=251701 RepID=UPI001F2EB332|nr:LysR family transcriptional regulator [Pseudomonas syringae group genomosp. 3]